ncbi:MAG: hypothetical protein ACK56F_21705, partial [bacterium]
MAHRNGCCWRACGQSQRREPLARIKRMTHEKPFSRGWHRAPEEVGAVVHAQASVADSVGRSVAAGACTVNASATFGTKRVRAGTNRVLVGT